MLILLNMEVLITFIFSLGMMVGCALVIRRPMLWYFRINDHIENQKRIIELLEKLTDENEVSF